MSITIYHNPHCSKSRETLKIIEDQGIEPRVIEYLNSPPDQETLTQILQQLGIKPRDLLRTHEDEYKLAGLDNPSKSDDDVIKAMIKYPRLIERPIVVSNGKAIIGRPPVKVLDILPE